MLTSGKCNHHHKVCLFTVCHSPISCRFGGVIMLIKSVFVSTYCQQLFIVVNKARKTNFLRFPNDVFYARSYLEMRFDYSQINL